MGMLSEHITLEGLLLYKRERHVCKWIEMIGIVSHVKRTVLLSAALVSNKVWCFAKTKNLERFTNLRVILAQGPC